VTSLKKINTPFACTQSMHVHCTPETHCKQVKHSTNSVQM